MHKLVVHLSPRQENRIAKFFLANPDILTMEHYIHTRAPLDNICHYLWEEFSESNHDGLRQAYVQQSGQLSDQQVEQWIREEMMEHQERKQRLINSNQGQ